MCCLVIRIQQKKTFSEVKLDAAWWIVLLMSRFVIKCHVKSCYMSGCVLALHYSTLHHITHTLLSHHHSSCLWFQPVHLPVQPHSLGKGTIFSRVNNQICQTGGTWRGRRRVDMQYTGTSGKDMVDVSMWELVKALAFRVNIEVTHGDNTKWHIVFMCLKWKDWQNKMRKEKRKKHSPFPYWQPNL